MKALIDKELTLSINRFFYVFPVLISALMMIPNWIFTLVFIYFFAITVPNVYVSYTTQGDYQFMDMLPVDKKSIVQSKILTFIFLELLHILFGVIFAIIHNLVYGSFNFFLDLNTAFFGLILIMFALFNIIFLPLYFKTAYQYGKPLIYGAIAVLLWGTAMEFSIVYVPFFRNLFEDNTLMGFVILLVGILIYGGLTKLATDRSIQNYERIQ